MALCLKFNGFSDFFSEVSQELDDHYNQTGIRLHKIQIPKKFWHMLLSSRDSLIRYSMLTGTPLKFESLTEYELTMLFHALDLTEIHIV